MRYAKLPPLNLDPDIMNMMNDFAAELDLTSYQTGAMKVLVGANRPVMASEISNYSHVPRTKVYGSLKKLVQRGLVVKMVAFEEDIEKPDIWEWWPQSKRDKFLAQNFVGLTFFAVNHEYLRDLYLTWSTKYYRLKVLVGAMVDAVAPQINVELVMVES